MFAISKFRLKLFSPTSARPCFARSPTPLSTTRSRGYHVASPSAVLSSCNVSSDKEQLTISFKDASFTFHAQWLHDSKCDKGFSKTADDTFCHAPFNATILGTDLIDTENGGHLAVTWGNGEVTEFPTPWLRIFAPLVARRHQEQQSKNPSGWLVSDLELPEYSYAAICSPGDPEGALSTKFSVFDSLLSESASGIIKITDVPPPDIEAERSKENTLVTRVLKELFGSVFVHPRRGADRTFNVASHHSTDKARGNALPNYDINEVLLPHIDHAHYTHPIRGKLSPI